MHDDIFYGGTVRGHRRGFSREDFYEVRPGLYVPDREVGCNTVKEDNKKATK